MSYSIKYFFLQNTWMNKLNKNWIKYKKNTISKIYDKNAIKQTIKIRHNNL
jgi:hypothetical protein